MKILGCCLTSLSSYFSFFKLEGKLCFKGDKLDFKGESIDKSRKTYLRKRLKKVADKEYELLYSKLEGTC